MSLIVQITYMDKTAERLEGIAQVIDPSPETTCFLLRVSDGSVVKIPATVVRRLVIANAPEPEATEKAPDKKKG